MKLDSQEAIDLLHRGMGAFQSGDLDGAQFFFKRVLDIHPKQFDALHFLGIIEAKRGRFDEADRLVSQSLKINRKTPEAYLNHVRILNALKRPEEVLKACDRSLALDPRNAEVLFHRGNALQEIKKYAEAVASYDKALALRSDEAVVWCNRGGALWKMEYFEEALVSFNKAVAIAPDFTFAWTNRAATLCNLHRLEDGLASYDRALAIDPQNYDALTGRGSVLYSLARYEHSLADRDRALAIRPNAILWLHRAGTLEQLKRFYEFLASYNEALAIDPTLVDAWFYGGNLLLYRQSFSEAKRYYEKVLQLNPSHRFALCLLVHSRQQMCDWVGLDQQVEELLSGIRTGKFVATSVMLAALPASSADQLASTKAYLDAMAPPRFGPMFDPTITSSGKLRIAYLSPDYRTHPTALSFIDVLERHNRDNFELIGISLGADDGSEIRARIIKAFDEFHDVRMQPDDSIARLIRDSGVHIAVDMAPHTSGYRPGILAYRPAPIQVNHLSTWTSGADYIDYVIADRYTVPFDQQPYFSEKIVHLPDCYFQRDTTQAISARTPARAEVGLPPEGFVFCSFNSSYKINRQMFEIWMRLLKVVDGSVLWLPQLNKDALENLLRESADRGVAFGRLITAPRVPLLEDHLARYRLADLFLDTLPYNAQTTASDALWAGLPVLTCLGDTFAGRAAASQLYAIGLDELVAPNLEQYEALALQLARDPDRLEGLRRKLEQNRSTSPLFNADRLCRHTEAAYLTMWERYRRGQTPESFAVTPVD